MRSTKLALSKNSLMYLCLFFIIAIGLYYLFRMNFSYREGVLVGDFSGQTPIDAPTPKCHPVREKLDTKTNKCVPKPPPPKNSHKISHNQP